MNSMAAKELKPYENAQAISLSHPDKRSYLKLDCNEATYPPSPKVIQSLVHFIQNEPLNWYPDVESHDLRVALSPYVGYPKEQILTFNGCDDALATICKTYLGKGSEAVQFAPTYDNFRVFAESAGGTVISVYARNPFETNVEGIKKALTPRTSLIYLANPNNPTGLIYSEAEVIYLLTSAPQSLVIVDEAYFEFWGKSSLPLIGRFPNLIITRSFSKAFALAGLRCGYLVSQGQNIAMIEKLRNGKGVNSLAQVAATCALGDLPYIQNQIQGIHEVKKWFVKESLVRGMEVVDTPANFALVRVESPDEAETILREQNILVRNRHHFPQLEGTLRITIGRKDEMGRMLEALQSLPRRMAQNSLLSVA